jgi:hopanoid biosynthesis associated protein HpnK
MVTALAAADAVERAHRLKSLRVGLHLVLVDGTPALGPAAAGALVRSDGCFDPDPLRAGIRFFFRPGMRHLLAAEIRAQFEAFRATGLVLDHVNGHKHIHLHPTVARLIVEIGRDYGMRAVRLPVEPVGPLRRAFPSERYRATPYDFAGAALRRRLRRAELATNDYVFGLAWSGAMIEARVLGLLPHLPEGISEIYFHPAVERTPALAAAMPGYRNREEFEALTSAAVRHRIDELGIALTTYGELANPW